MSFALAFIDSVRRLVVGRFLSRLDTERSRRAVPDGKYAKGIDLTVAIIIAERVENVPQTSAGTTRPLLRRLYFETVHRLRPISRGFRIRGVERLSCLCYFVGNSDTSPLNRGIQTGFEASRYIHIKIVEVYQYACQISGGGAGQYRTQMDNVFRATAHFGRASRRSRSAT